MIFSYYLDVDKTHLINMKFNVKQILVQNSMLQVTFDAVVEEVLDGTVLHSESQSGAFTLSSSRVDDPTSSDGYDINFIRTRYADQNKWIFEIQNNSQPDQVVLVGLYSTTATGNPLGEDIIQDDDSYNFILKGNNIGQLEETYVPPVLTQNVVNTDFSQLVLPYGFTTVSGIYDSAVGRFLLSDFSHTFPNSIDPDTAFTLTANLAPMQTDSVSDEIFHVTLHGIGQVTLYKTYLAYLREGDDPSNTITIFFGASADPTWFLSPPPYFTDKSKFSVQADGAGGVTVKYAGVSLIGSYDPSNPFAGVDLQAAARADKSLVVCAFDNYTIEFFK
ncbi:hypothetical protein [Alicyclobacillus shizuokensis]|uniref:hypothetical protein n=1 Tax=Alicyclobacillus shizuokensis TaxID=392014 RepID=UPI0008378332|nr:hypothetical protein [Alicyclobacillus shizuokensis]